MTELDPALEQVLSNTSSSVAMVRIAGIDYPLESDTRCAVCQSVFREQVEQGIISGRTFNMISKSLPENVRIPRDSIKRHSDLHMIETNRHMRAALERRAAARGVNVESGVEELVDHLAVAEAVVLKGYERIASGEVKVTVKEMLVAAKFLADYDVPEEADQDDYVDGFVHFMDAVYQVMTPEQVAQFNTLLEQDEGLQALIAKSERENSTALE